MITTIPAGFTEGGYDGNKKKKPAYLIQIMKFSFWHNNCQGFRSLCLFLTLLGLQNSFEDF